MLIVLFLVYILFFVCSVLWTELATRQLFLLHVKYIIVSYLIKAGTNSLFWNPRPWEIPSVMGKTVKVW